MSTVALPDLSTDYNLDADQVASYQQDGHILLRQLAKSEEVAAFEIPILQAVEKARSQVRNLAERDTYGKAFIQVMNIWRYCETVRHFVFARRFAKVAAELMGVEGVRIYHDQALFKEPGGGGTPWHQDQHYWPLDTDKTITMWMPLVDADAAMGTMSFASGSQAEGYLGDLPISDKSDDIFKKFLEQRGYPIVKAGAMKAGDATFHSGWTLHGAPGNSSDKMREVMTIIYFADGTRVGHTDNENRKSDLVAWLPGLKPGDLAASPINPLVYSAL